MITVITIDDLKKLIAKTSLEGFFKLLIEQLKADYSRWDYFQKHPRHATHYPDGVIELMPISDEDYYAFKYVNGHPENTHQNKQTVVATGQLSSAKNGYPILLSEMTLLTALRTAATSALCSEYMAPKNASTFGIIGTGAQSEFQTLAHVFTFPIKEVFYFDTDPHAMEKFRKNLSPYSVKLTACKNGREVIDRSAIITTATAQKGHHKIIENDWITRGCHINKIGGDSPGKTELDPQLIARSKIVVEFPPQTKIEGEIQQSNAAIYAELHELVRLKKPGRKNPDEITLFDSVGFAIEDYSALRLIDNLSKKYSIGHMLNMIPETPDPKNLFEVLI